MIREELIQELQEFLNKPGSPKANLSHKSPIIQHIECRIHEQIPVVLFPLTYKDQSPPTIQYIAALSVPDKPPVIFTGKQNEAAIDVATAALEKACSVYECDGTPEKCLFKKTLRTKSDKK